MKAVSAQHHPEGRSLCSRVPGVDGFHTVCSLFQDTFLGPQEGLFIVSQYREKHLLSRCFLPKILEMVVWMA